jgi:hypothetical protein
MLNKNMTRIFAFGCCLLIHCIKLLVLCRFADSGLAYDFLNEYARGEEGRRMLCLGGVLKIKIETVFSVSCFMGRVAESEACIAAAF